MELCREHRPEWEDLKVPKPDEDPVKAFYKAVDVADKVKTMRDKQEVLNARIRREKQAIFEHNVELMKLAAKIIWKRESKYLLQAAIAVPFVMAIFVYSLLAAERFPLVWVVIYTIGCVQVYDRIRPYAIRQYNRIRTRYAQEDRQSR